LFIDDTANKVNSDTGNGGVLARKKAVAEAGINVIVEDKARAIAEAEVAEAEARARAEIDAEAESEVGAEAEARAKARVEAEARIVACEKAETEARAEAEPIFIATAEFQALTTPLHHLATDCLQLSMHFFHPIQQCAQQVYHTAIPLSPTSSHLQKCSLQSVVDNQLSLVTTFSGAPDTWGLLLRTIDIRPRQLTCISTSVQGIIAACGDHVNIYDPITFVLHQSLSTPEAVTKIQVSPDGTILFFAHSLSVTMWDVQTGGLIHTFTVESEISDIAASKTGEHIACGCTDGTVTFWNTHTRKCKGKGLGNGQSIITICWVSPLEAAIATYSSLHAHNVATNRSLNIRHGQGQVWGVVCMANKEEFLVGTSPLGGRVCWSAFEIGIHIGGSLPCRESHEQACHRQLSQPVLVGEEIVCITHPTGVQSFNTRSYSSTNPPLLDAATSVAVSLNRNLITQTKDSIQIFSTDVLTSDMTHDVVHTVGTRVYDQQYMSVPSRVVPTFCY